MARQREVLAEGVANEAVVGQDAAQVVVTFKHDAVQVEGFALVPVGRVPKVVDGVDQRQVVVGAEHLDAHALVQADRQQVHGHAETRPLKAHFAVCENRRFGVQQLKKQNPEAILLLDDAFQHRWVKAGLNIVLSTFDRPFWNDALLPAGRLRESAYALKRADALVITKCPAFDSFDANELVQISAKFDIPVFFSGYRYKPLQVLTRPVAALNKALLVSAIADPKQLEHGLPKTMHFEQLHFADHHAYTKQDIKAIHHFFDTFADENTVLVTTAKDWIKIASLLSKEEQQKYPWYLLSFELEWHDQAAFNQFISAYVVSN
mgnify:CR=1 FL=1